MRDPAVPLPIMPILFIEPPDEITSAATLGEPGIVELGRFCVVSSQMSLVPTDFAPTPQKRLDYEDRAEWFFYGPPESRSALPAAFSALANDWRQAVLSQRGVLSRMDDLAPIHADMPLLASQTLTINWAGNTPFELWEDIAEKMGANGAMRWILENPRRSVAVRVAREPGLLLWLGHPAEQAASRAEHELAATRKLEEDDFSAAPLPRLQVVRLFGLAAEHDAMSQESAPCFVYGLKTLARLSRQWVLAGRLFEDNPPPVDEAEFFDPFSRRAWPPRAPRHALLWAVRQTAPAGVLPRAVGQKLPSRLALRPYPWLLTIQTEADDHAMELWAQRLGDFLSLSLSGRSLMKAPIETHSDAQNVFSARKPPINALPKSIPFR